MQRQFERARDLKFRIVQIWQETTRRDYRHASDKFDPFDIDMRRRFRTERTGSLAGADYEEGTFRVASARASLIIVLPNV